MQKKEVTWENKSVYWERERSMWDIWERSVQRVIVPLSWNAVKANKVTVDLSKVSCQTEKPKKHEGGKQRGIPPGLYNLNGRLIIVYTPLKVYDV